MCLSYEIVGDVELDCLRKCSFGNLDRLRRFRNCDFSSGVLWGAVDPDKLFNLMFVENSENLQSSH